MSKHWWIIGCKIGEALADSSSLIFLFCRGENWGLKRGSSSSHPRIRTLRKQPTASCTQMGDFCCKCMPFSKSPILTRLFSCKVSLLLFVRSGGPALAEQFFQGILNGTQQSSYWYFQCLIEHPWSKSCMRPGCNLQGPCGHINFQPTQWLKVLGGLACAWLSSLFQMPLSHFMAHWLCPPKGEEGGESF